MMPLAVRAAEHLLSLGHRKLAVLISEPHVPTVEAKVEGFETGPGWLGLKTWNLSIAGLSPGSLRARMLLIP